MVSVFCVTAKLKVQRRIENVYMMLMDLGEGNCLLEDRAIGGVIILSNNRHFYVLEVVCGT